MATASGRTQTTRRASAPRPALIETIASADAQADDLTGTDACYAAMEMLVVCGDVQQAAWDRYYTVYAAVRARLAQHRRAQLPVLSAAAV